MYRFIKKANAIIYLAIIVLSLLICPNHVYASEHIYPSYYIEPGSPILKSEYPNGLESGDRVPLKIV